MAAGTSLTFAATFTAESLSTGSASLVVGLPCVILTDGAVDPEKGIHLQNVKMRGLWNGTLEPLYVSLRTSDTALV